MKLKHTFLYLISTVLLFSCTYSKHTESKAGPPPPGWQLVYRHDENGNPLQGDLQALVQGIRNGYPMEIGWGWVLPGADSTLRLEHRSTPIFISVIQDRMVSAILPGHPVLSSYIDPAGHVFKESGAHWQAVLTTQGNFNAQLRQPGDGHLLKEWPQRHKISWYMEYPNKKSKPNNPLYE